MPTAVNPTITLSSLLFFLLIAPLSHSCSLCYESCNHYLTAIKKKPHRHVKLQQQQQQLQQQQQNSQLTTSIQNKTTTNKSYNTHTKASRTRTRIMQYNQMNYNTPFTIMLLWTKWMCFAYKIIDKSINCILQIHWPN